MAASSTAAQKLMGLFRGHEDAHGTHGVPVRDGQKWEIKTTARTLRGGATEDLWRQHVEGKRPLGVVPIMEDSSCVWGSIDIDVYDRDLLDVVRRVEKLPLVPCRSKSGGLHLFMFVSEPVPAGDMQAALRDLAASLGYAKSEIFPKQTQVLTERGDVGNWMVMPYYGGTFDGKLRNQHGLKKTGAEMTVMEFVSLAQRVSMSVSEFSALERKTKPTASKSKRKGARTGGTVGEGTFGDGPPCLQHMAVGGFPEGARNNSLFMIGLYLKRAYPSDWEKEIEKANRDYMKPPMSSDEVTGVIRSLKKKEYEYTCKLEPMCSHCDAAVCRTRKFGVGDTGDFPAISGLRKLNSEPAIWFVDVGDKCLEIGTPDLMNYARFQTVCAEQLHRFFGVMKQADWVRVLGEAGKSLVVIEPSPDVGVMGRFKELINEFLTNRAKGDRREDILSGRPWESEEEKRHYFRVRDLQNFLVRENVKDMTRGQLIRRVEKLGGGHTFFNVKGHGVNVWFVPSSIIDTAPEVDPPPVKGDPV